MIPAVSSSKAGRLATSEIFRERDLERLHYAKIYYHSINTSEREETGDLATDVRRWGERAYSDWVARRMGSLREDFAAG